MQSFKTVLPDCLVLKFFHSYPLRSLERSNLFWHRLQTDNQFSCKKEVFKIFSTLPQISFARSRAGAWFVTTIECKSEQTNHKRDTLSTLSLTLPRPRVLLTPQLHVWHGNCEQNVYSKVKNGL